MRKGMLAWFRYRWGCFRNGHKWQYIMSGYGDAGTTITWKCPCGKFKESWLPAGWDFYPNCNRR